MKKNGLCCPPPALRVLEEPVNNTARNIPPPERAMRIPGGQVNVGTDSPLIPQDGEGVRRVRIKPFLIDPFTVTNGWFGEFTAATGHVTTAERLGWSYVFFQFVDHDQAGSPSVPGADWWRGIEGASWRHPEGPGSTTEGREYHPVVHVSLEDAAAFAAWAGGRLPGEAEWEHAARGGLNNPVFPWGDVEPGDDGPHLCNIWQGEFPRRNTAADGFAGTAPVTSFAPNGYGLHNMAGNVWEWCADTFRVRSLRKDAAKRNAQAHEEGHKVLKGGSYLCHRSYCYRYRIAARTSSPPNSTTGHLGFRIVWP